MLSRVIQRLVKGLNGILILLLLHQGQAVGIKIRLRGAGGGDDLPQTGAHQGERSRQQGADQQSAGRKAQPVCPVTAFKQIDVLQIIPQSRRVGIAPGGVELGAFVQDVLDAHRQGGVQPAHRTGPVGRVKRTFAGEQMVKGHAQRVDVGAGIRHPVAELLGGAVPIGTGMGTAAGRFLTGFPGNAEIQQLEAAVRAEHDVGRLEVPVDNGRRLAVQILEHIAQHGHPGPGGGFRNFALLLQNLLQGAAPDIFLHQILVSALGKGIHDAGQHGVVQLAEQAVLAAGISRLLRPGHLFDGHQSVQADVLRQIDGGHAARPQNLQDAVGLIEKFHKFSLSKENHCGSLVANSTEQRLSGVLRRMTT